MTCVVADPEKYVLDLRRAAFGAGSTADSISRSSMMDSGECWYNVCVVDCVTEILSTVQIDVYVS